MMAISNEEFENVLFDRWYHVRKKDIESTKGLYGHSVLQVHGCIHKEKVIACINPSFEIFFINAQLVNRLQVKTKNMKNTHIEGNNIQVLKYLKLTIDKYVLHFDFFLH
jgi:hypothetical protein